MIFFLEISFSPLSYGETIKGRIMIFIDSEPISIASCTVINLQIFYM